MWDLYSNIYGAMPMVYDWKDDDNYTGPFCWLCPSVRSGSWSATAPI